MPALILNEHVSDEVIAERKRLGLDRWDEVWDGVYVVMTEPNNEHQKFVLKLAMALEANVDQLGRGETFPGCNVSDRTADWRENYRCPDVAVYLDGNPAIDRDTHWQGGPDLAIEIVSPGDRSREKLGLYAAVGTREVLIIDREPWRLELYRNDGSAEMKLIGIAEHDGATIRSEAVPLAWKLVAGDDRPVIDVASEHPAGHWRI